MKGEIISIVAGDGQIRGEDGRQYRFQPADLAVPAAQLSLIRRVDFVPDGEWARQILVLETGSSHARIESRNSDGKRMRHQRTAPLDTFFGYAATGLTRRYFDFHGRARRKEYFAIILVGWLFVLCPLVLQGVLSGSASDVTAVLEGNSRTIEPPLVILSYIVLALLLIPSLSAAVRRLHDTGRSGWVWCISLLPYIGGLIVLVFMLLPGQRGHNRYGPEPER